MRHELVKCPSCGNEVFLDTEKNDFRCSDCSFHIDLRVPIIQAGKYKVAVNRYKKIYQYITDSSKQKLYVCTGEIVESKKAPGLFGLKNLTQNVWMLTTKNKNNRPIAPGEVVPLLIGNEIAFGNGSSAKIV